MANSVSSSAKNKLHVSPVPGLPQLSRVGWELHQLRLWPQAEAIFRYVLDEDPSYSRALNNLSVVRGCQNDLTEAEDLVRRALDGETGNQMYRVNLATILLDQGRFEEAEREFRTVLKAEPEHIHANSSLGILLLRSGRFEEAWPYYARRQAPKRHGKRYRSVKTWSGERLRGKSLVILNEQGIGEEFQTARLYRRLNWQGAKVTLICDPRLVELFARSFPQFTVLSHLQTQAVGEVLGSADYVSLLNDLISVLAPTANPRAGQGAYLKPDMERVRALREKYRLRFGDRKLIGFSWGTSSTFKQSARTIPVERWKPLLERSDCQFISLQYNASPKLLEAYVRDLGVSVATDETVDAKDDLDGLAAQIMALDHVITIDNTTAHLAAAVGQPVWTLLTRYPHWLWGLKGEKPDWYPAMRLFRQGDDEEWGPVLEAVSAALDTVSSEGSVSRRAKPKLRVERRRRKDDADRPAGGLQRIA